MVEIGIGDQQIGEHADPLLGLLGCSEVTKVHFGSRSWLGVQLRRERFENRWRKLACDLQDGGQQLGPCLVHASTSRKNASSLPAKVGTSNDRSRYLLPISQDVSATKEHAWHAAPC